MNANGGGATIDDTPASWLAKAQVRIVRDETVDGNRSYVTRCCTGA
jgi:hypothetical protein